MCLREAEDVSRCICRSEADASDEKHLRLLSEVSFDTDNASSSSCDRT